MKRSSSKHTKSLLSFLIAMMLFSQISFGQEIPKDRLTDWSLAGANLSHTYTKSISIASFNADKTGKIAIDESITAALTALGDEGGIIQFEAGTYLFNKTISMPSNVVLSGKGSAETTFIFDLKGAGNCIDFSGKIINKALNVMALPKVGDNQLSLSAPLKQNDLIFIRERGYKRLHNSWAYNHLGQIVKVAETKGNTITFSEGLRLEITDLSLTDVRVISPVQNSGIEGLKIIRKDRSSSKVANIAFKYASDCFVHGVESEMTNYGHIVASHSAYLNISGSYFHHSLSYGSGGKGYGVLLHFSTSNCLIENNIFKHLRHSMILQAGANGNVFGYNYSTDPYWNQSFFPSNTAGDIVLHGNYPYYNLFEGNIAQNLVIDGSHGRNGPNNTFFRNRLEYLGITCIANPPTNNQNVIANEVTSTGFLSGLFILFGDNHFIQYNLVGDAIQGSDIEPMEKSLYLNEKPSYFSDESWPVAGSKSVYNNSTLPAKKRFEAGGFTQFTPTSTGRPVSKTIEKKGFWYRLFHKK